MTTYYSEPTQEQKILKLAKTRGEDGFYVYELIAPTSRGGLGIAQYNARIWGLRKKGHNIVNKRPGYFVYEEN